MSDKFIRKTQIKDVTINNETIKDVKFTSYEDIWQDNPLRPKWTFWDKITIPFYRGRQIISDTYYRIRRGFQRMFKGYDDYDVFELFSGFISRYNKILTDYRKTHYGYPADLTEEKWDAIIDEMLYHLKFMDETYVEDSLCEGMPEHWLPDNMVVYEIMKRHKDEFFKLFSKYFYNLWD
jgi:hypothetical protein